jgi:hypothetical protein
MCVRQLGGRARDEFFPAGRGVVGSIGVVNAMRIQGWCPAPSLERHRGAVDGRRYDAPPRA